MHSTHSDGTDSPRHLVELARDTGLAAIALTDHDTFSGVAEAQAAGRELGVRVLSGVEISLEYAGKTVHMLAYCFDSGAPRLKEGLDRLVQGRNDRNRRIVANFNRIGVDLALEEVESEAGGKVVGRPHFARVLMRKGIVQDRQEAFDRFLARGAACYEERLRFTPADSVRMIREAGGVPVLAHPKFVPLMEGESLDAVVRDLAEAGLLGIECHYSLHTAEETRHYLDLARRHGLLVTGGTDYHGAIKPDIRMGVGCGNLTVPLECAEALEATAG
jgi:hypothetical protein